MPNFLRLTRFNNYTRQQCDALVNMDTVTYIKPVTLNLQKKMAPTPKPEGGYDYQNIYEEHPAATYNLSLISFAAGMNEECEAIYVLESLDTIYRSA
jgi:hypothetical protein